MSYKDFAYLYDSLMEDVEYSLWIDFILEKVKLYSNQNVGRILDLACGTGQLSVKLAEAGFDVVGVDLSEDMLAVANAKADQENQRIAFYQQDMTKMAGLQSFDFVVIFCDSLNYLESAEDVKKTFQNVYDTLSPDGLFMFDVHSTYKVNEIFMDQTFTSNDEDISYIWNCFPGENDHSVEHELSFFVKKNVENEYERFEEIHYQRTFPIEDYREWLVDIGFEVIEINADFDQGISEQSERIFFTTKKRTE
jgi:SAM-dependent methyltransferase